MDFEEPFLSNMNLIGLSVILRSFLIFSSSSINTSVKVHKFSCSMNYLTRFSMKCSLISNMLESIQYIFLKELSHKIFEISVQWYGMSSNCVQATCITGLKSQLREARKLGSKTHTLVSQWQ